MNLVKQILCGAMVCMAQELCAQTVVEDKLPEVDLSFQSPFYQLEVKKVDDEFPVYNLQYKKESIYSRGAVNLWVIDSNNDQVLSLQHDDVIGADYSIKDPINRSQELGTTFKEGVAGIRVERFMDQAGDVTRRETYVDQTIVNVVERAKKLLEIGQEIVIQSFDREHTEKYRR
jgi:hypothetical protein